jgi:hypothetical protein
VVKGSISDQVTEKCCGCFLAWTIVSQWLRGWELAAAAWLARRVRRAKQMQEKTLADVHVGVCMYRGAGDMFDDIQLHVMVYVVLCCAVLCCAVLCRAVLCCAVP